MSLSDSEGDSDGGGVSVALTVKYADKYSRASFPSESYSPALFLCLPHFNLLFFIVMNVTTIVQLSSHNGVQKNIIHT